MEWSRLGQYRADVILWMIAETAIPFLSLAVWYTVALSGQTGPTPQEIVTYYILIAFIKIATDSWGGMFLTYEILDGDIVKDLIRPIWPMWKKIANNINEKTIKLIFPTLIGITVLLLWPNIIDTSLLTTPHLLLAAASLILAIVLAFVLDITLGLIAFWLEDAFQIRRYKFMLEYVASGLIIPFAVMPPIARTLFEFLPFRYVLSFPAELALGQAEGARALEGFGIQLTWTIGLLILSWLMWRAGLKRYAVPGR
ncbi:MAG: ABC-2 family transporter protein [Candidatus Andersenbacteria bacterium]